MKKLLLLSCLLGLTSIGYAKEIAPVVEPVEEVIVEPAPMMPYGHGYLKAGTDIGGTYDTHNGLGELKSDQDHHGYEIVLEGTKYLTPDFEMGLGVAYQKHGEAEKIVNKGKFREENYDSIPVYVLAKYNFDLPMNPYLKAAVGWSFNTDYERKVDGVSKDMEIDDGMYYGIGVGIELGKFFTEVMYQVTKAKVENESKEELNMNYDRFTIGVGYKF